MENLFNNFTTIINSHLPTITQIALDNFMLFSDKEDLVKVIKNDLGRFAIEKQLQLPTDVYVNPDSNQHTEFDPPISNHEMVIIYKIDNDTMLKASLSFEIIRPETRVIIEGLLALAKRTKGDEWLCIRDEHVQSECNFSMLNTIRTIRKVGQ